MTNAPPEERPTAVLVPTSQDAWRTEAVKLAEELAAMGQRPWFRVYWPPTADLTVGGPHDAIEWRAREEATYDVLELVDGELVTAPSFESEEGAA